MQKKPDEVKFFIDHSQSGISQWKFHQLAWLKLKNGRDRVKSSQKTSHKKVTNQGPPLGVHMGAGIVLNLFMRKF